MGIPNFNNLQKSIELVLSGRMKTAFVLAKDVNTWLNIPDWKRQIILPFRVH